jgi:hypothetical protein
LVYEQLERIDKQNTQVGNQVTKAVLLIVVSAFLQNARTQVIEKPNSAMKSHETLEIVKIQTDKEKIVVYFSLENKIPGGNFCADRNIYIITPGGSRLRLKEASGIPVCPDTYKFKSPGEKLFFALSFPPLSGKEEWIDIIEDCDQNCFWFYGITLDNDLNNKLNEVFRKAATSKPEENVLAFRNMLENTGTQNSGITGLLYINIINAAIEAGDKVEAAVWYKRLQTSGAPRADHYIRFLNERGIEF